MKKRIVFCVTLIFIFLISVVLCHASSKTLDLFTITETENFSQFGFNTLSSTAALGWTSKDSSKLERSTQKGIGGYVLTSVTEGGKAYFSTSLAAPLDLYENKRLYFVVCPRGESDTCSFELEIKTSDDSFFYGGKLHTDVWSVISLDVGFIRDRSNVTAFSLAIDGENPVSSVSFSGPYARNEDKLKVSNLLSNEFVASGTSLEYSERGKNNEKVSFALAPQRITITGNPSVTGEKFDCNAIRIVMTNHSVYNSMELRYVYFDRETGQYRTASSFVALEPESSHFSYIVDTVKVGLISSFSLVFDDTRGGNVTIERIEAVNVYPKKADTSYGTILNARIDQSKKKVIISGTVNHNFLIMHDSYTLACYALRIGEELQDVISDGAKPIATRQMSSQFNFEIKMSKLEGNASTRRFIVAAMSPEGDTVAVTNPVFAEANFGTPSTSSGRTNIKGIESELALGLTESGLGYAIVDLWLDKLVNDKNSGILCAVGEEFICLESSYLEEIDMQVKNLHAAGSEVFLRLLISSGADINVLPYADTYGKTDKSKFLAVNISDKRAETHFASTVEYLAKRYSGTKNGKISGVILGKSLDLRDEFFASSAKDSFAYAKQVAEATEIMAHSAAAVIPGIKIFLPISEQRYENVGALDSELLLASICRVFEENGGLPFSLMLEGTSIPYGISAGMFSEESIRFDNEGNLILNSQRRTKKAELAPHGEESNIYGTDNIYVFERLLYYLAGLSTSAPKSYIYCWSPDFSKIGNGLSAVYVYNYYRLMFSERAAAFVLSTDKGKDARIAIGKLNYLMRYIDTEKNSGGELCKSVLEFFGETSWQNLIDGYDEELLVHRTYYEVEFLKEPPNTVKGKYSAWNFSRAFGVLDWFKGAGCKSVTVGSTLKKEKSLHAVMESGTDELYSCADLVYKYASPEDASFLSHISFDFTVGEADDGVLYEVMILLRGGKIEIASNATVNGGEATDMIIDIGKYKDFSAIDSIHICVRRISGEADDSSFDFYLRKVRYFSEKYSDAELKTAVEESRAKSKNQLTTQTNDDDKKTHTEIIIIALLVMAVAVGMAAFVDKRHQELKK